MSKKTSLILLALLVLSVPIFSGCLKKSSEGIQEKAPIAQPSAPKEAQQERDLLFLEEENLPAPTGKVDDAVQAAVSAASREGEEVAADEADALLSVDDSQETNDFGQAYDENEF